MDTLLQAVIAVFIADRIKLSQQLDCDGIHNSELIAEIMATYSYAGYMEVRNELTGL